MTIGSHCLLGKWIPQSHRMNTKNVCLPKRDRVSAHRRNRLTFRRRISDMLEKLPATRSQAALFLSQGAESLVSKRGAASRRLYSRLIEVDR